MKHTIDHPLPIETARKVARKAFAAYAERFSKYNPTAQWETDDSAKIGFEAKGVKLGGVVELRDGAIDVDMDVPFIFKPFRSRAMEIIEGEIRKWIGKAESGELDDDEEE